MSTPLISSPNCALTNLLTISAANDITSHSFSAEVEVTVALLMEIDKLVQLIESPVFTCKSSSR